MKNKPKISFTFPIRWINDKEDREHLKENIEKMISRVRRSGAPVHPDLPQHVPMGAYSVLIRQHAWQPERIKLTKTQLEKILKDVLPGQKLINYETFFVQKNNKNSLPILEMQIFY